MRLETALLSGREGLNAHGQAISVVGDNIANSNTTAYKESRVEFADLFSQGADGAQVTTMPTSGDGVTVREVRPIFNEGAIEATGRELDVGIDGNGFFMVGSADSPLYTRAGNFSVNDAGELVNSEGLTLLGFPVGSTTLGAMNISNLTLTGAATTTGSINLNFDPSLATVTPPTAPGSFTALGQAGGSTSSMRVYDSLGGGHDVNMYYFHTGTNQWTVQAYVDGADVNGTSGTPVLIGSQAITFQTDGTIAAADQAGASVAASNVAWSNGAAAGSFAINFGSSTQYASPFSVRANTQDGQALGNISGYSISSDGKVEALLDSGSRQLIGTIKLGDFLNRDTLERAGNNSFRALSPESAVDPGSPGSGSYGSLKSGALERSTVDLSNQFTDLVVYQRGYQANSQTINAVNQLLQNTIGLLR